MHWDYQEEIFAKTIEVKLKNRKENTSVETENTLIFCEHPHVYTLGKSGDENNLLVNEEYLKTLRAIFIKLTEEETLLITDPGQIVGYPILDLENFFTDIHKYLRLLEER